jgi:YD repeat-containing protein
MTVKTYTFEGTQGTTVTAANSGVSQVSSSPGTITYDAAMAATGTTGAKFVSASSVIAIARPLANAPANQMAFSGTVTTPAVAPSGGLFVTVMTLRHASGTVLRVKYTAAGALVLQDATGANDVTLLTGVALATQYRIEIVALVGAATSAPFDGHYAINVYPAGGGSTPLNGSPVTGTTYNLGTAAIVGGDVGVTNVIAQVVTMGWDDVQFNDGGTTEIGPYVPPAQSFTSFPLTTSWSTVGGGTVTANMSDNDDATGVIATNPTGLPFKGQLPALVKPAAGADLVCPYRGFRSTSTSGSIVAKLYEGGTAGVANSGTLRSTVTGIAIPTSIGPITVIFPAADLVAVNQAAFTAGLYVQLEVTAA